jgi:hypothetical protein
MKKLHPMLQDAYLPRKHENYARGRDEERALKELRQAHDKWKRTPGIKFNKTWLEGNGFFGLYGWACTNFGTFGNFISNFELDSEIVFSEVSKARDFNRETSVVALAEAYKKWSLEPNRRRRVEKRFNRQWLIKNGYGDLVDWAKLEFGDFKSFVDKQAVDEIKRDYVEQKQEKRSMESIVEDLLEAHKKWVTYRDKKNSAGKGRKIAHFTGSWLMNNGYGYLFAWAEIVAGGIDKVLVNSAEEVRNDFRVDESFNKKIQGGSKWEVPGFLKEEMDRAYEMWLKKSGGKSFNEVWLGDNGFGGLVLQLRKQNAPGGISRVIKQFLDDQFLLEAA